MSFKKNVVEMNKKFQFSLFSNWLGIRFIVWFLELVSKALWWVATIFGVVPMHLACQDVDEHAQVRAPPTKVVTLHTHTCISGPDLYKHFWAGLVSGLDLSSGWTCLGAGLVLEQDLSLGQTCLAAENLQKFRAGSVSRPEAKLL